MDDIAAYLARWPYDPESPYRVICGKDGRPKLQVRTPLGLLQFDLDGRPDGLRPSGAESLLDLWESRLAAYCVRHHTESGFSIPSGACADLCNEASLYYERYMSFFRTGDFERAARDTGRNLRCLDLLARYAEDQEIRLGVERYRANILQINRASLAMLAVRRGQYDVALKEIDRGIRAVRGITSPDTPQLVRIRKRAVAFLKRLGKEIRLQRPVTRSEELQKSLHEAVATEDYERAAQLRDRLRLSESNLSRAIAPPRQAADLRP